MCKWLGHLHAFVLTGTLWSFYMELVSTQQLMFKHISFISKWKRWYVLFPDTSAIFTRWNANLLRISKYDIRQSLWSERSLIRRNCLWSFIVVNYHCLRVLKNVFKICYNCIQFYYLEMLDCNWITQRVMCYNTTFYRKILVIQECLSKYEVHKSLAFWGSPTLPRNSFFFYKNW